MLVVLAKPLFEPLHPEGLTWNPRPTAKEQKGGLEEQSKKSMLEQEEEGVRRRSLVPQLQLLLLEI